MTNRSAGWHLALATALLLLLATAQAHAQRQSGPPVPVLGSVVDSAGAPIDGAEILLLGTQTVWKTNERGAFVGSLRPGSHLLRVRRFGYEPRNARLDIIGTDTATVFFTLEPMAVELAPVLVEARERKYVGKMSGFAERMHSQGAPASSFITREDIERERPGRVSDLLRRRSARAAACASGMIYLDGAAWTPLQIRARRDPTRTHIDEIFIDEVEAIEVYSGMGQIPAQYNRTGPDGRPPGCVVLVWTR